MYIHEHKYKNFCFRGKKLMTPKETVKYLDEYIIGQKDAKKAIAIALRNRYRNSYSNLRCKKR